MHFSISLFLVDTMTKPTHNSTRSYLSVEMTIVPQKTMKWDTCILLLYTFAYRFFNFKTIHFTFTFVIYDLVTGHFLACVSSRSAEAVETKLYVDIDGI